MKLTICVSFTLHPNYTTYERYIRMVQGWFGIFIFSKRCQHQNNKTLCVVECAISWQLPSHCRKLSQFAKIGQGIVDRLLYCIIMWCPLTPKFTTLVTFSLEIMITSHQPPTTVISRSLYHIYLKARQLWNQQKFPLLLVWNKPAHKMWVYALTSWRYCNKQCER
jgi:hypothetical protein